MAPRGRSVTLGIDIVAQDKGASRVIAGQRREVAGLGEELQKTAALAGGGFAVFRGFEGLEDAARSASSLTEAQNTANQVFREADDLVRDFARGAADSYGQSERAALSYSNTFGAILNNMGLTRQESARTSVELLKLGSDLAAAWDTDVDDALAALQSGLSGQTEPMRRYGVELTQNALKQDALNLGISTSIEKLDRRQKAEVILASVMRQTADQQGQFNREIDGYNQQQQIATAKAENAKAAFGDGLVPVFTKLQQLIGGVSGAFASLPKPLQDVAAYAAAGGLAIGAVTVAAGLLVPAVVAGKASLIGLGVSAKAAALNLVLPKAAIDGLGTSATKAQGPIGGLITRIGASPIKFGAASAAAVVLAGAWYDASQDAKRLDENVNSLLASIEAGQTPLEAFNEQLARTFAGVEGGFKIEGRESVFRAWMKSIGADAEDVSKAITGTKEDWESFIVDIAKSAPPNVYEALVGMRQAFEKAEDQSAALEATNKALGVANDDLAGSSDQVTAATERQKSATERLTEAVKARYDAVQKEWDLNEARKDAARELAEAREAEAQAIADAERTSEVYRDAQRAVDDALRGVADAERGVRDAREGQVDALNSVRDAQQRLNEARREAVVRLIDLHQAAQEAATAEAGAVLALERARKEAERTAASGADGLARREAQQKVREAEDALSAARIDGKKATDEYALAERQGVEGAPDVVAAKKAIVDANKAVRDANERVADSERSVRDATERVADAQKAQRKVAVDTAKAREEASRRVKEAMFREAEAIADVSAETKGATQGVIDHIAALSLLRQTVAPGSQLYNDLSAFMLLLSGALPGGQVAQGNQSLANAEWEIAKGASSSAPVRGSNNVTINNTYVGTPKGQRAAQEAASKKSAVDLLRGN